MQNDVQLVSAIPAAYRFISSCNSVIAIVQMQASGQLVQAVTAACEVAGLQAVPALVNKCLQLQDTLAVRFGVMLVGPAGLPAEPCNSTLLQKPPLTTCLAHDILSFCQCSVPYV